MRPFVSITLILGIMSVAEALLSPHRSTASISSFNIIRSQSRHDGHLLPPSPTQLYSSFPIDKDVRPMWDINGDLVDYSEIEDDAVKKWNAQPVETEEPVPVKKQAPPGRSTTVSAASTTVSVNAVSSINSSNNNNNVRVDTVKQNNQAAGGFSQTLKDGFTKFKAMTGQAPVQQIVLSLHTVFCIYQVLTTTRCLSTTTRKFLLPAAMAGTTPLTTQPLVRDWAFAAVRRRQLHRYIMAAFVEGNALSWLLHRQALKRIPTWLEADLGSAAYGTTVVVSIVASHLAHATWGSGLTMGLAGALSGLYGLWAATTFQKIQDANEDSNHALRSIASGMGQQVLMALSLPRVSLAAQIGGFAAGGLAGLALSSPKNPENQARVGTILKSFWMAVLIAMICTPALRQVPGNILQSLLRPGSLLTRGGRFH